MKLHTSITLVTLALILAIAGIDITLIATGHVEEALNVLGGVAILVGMIVFFAFLGLL